MLSRILFRFFNTYSSVILFPVTVTFGFLGYKIESWISDRSSPTLKSVKDRRAERLLNEEKEVESLKHHKFVPKTIFEKNLPPSLMKSDSTQKNSNQT